jgi:hypothetical protein
VLAPIAVGFALGYQVLGSYLSGAIAVGVLMAIFLANSGGAWDNAKKLVEDGNHGGMGSEAHAATVIGDTVGDPFKDTADLSTSRPRHHCCTGRSRSYTNGIRRPRPICLSACPRPQCPNSRWMSWPACMSSAAASLCG